MRRKFGWLAAFLQSRVVHELTGWVPILGILHNTKQADCYGKVAIGLSILSIKLSET